MKMHRSTRTFYIKHTHRMAFDVPVFCEPAQIRLQPRVASHISLRRMRIDISPRPVAMSSSVDLLGNVVWHALFNDITMSLTVAATSVVDCHDGSVCDASWRLPPCVQEEAELLRPYRIRDKRRWRDARRILEDASLGVGPASDGKLSREVVLDRLLHSVVNHHRWRATSSGPRLLLQDGTAADVTQLGAEPSALFLEAARALEIPARLVQGYRIDEFDEIEHSLCHWVECYVGERGWLGFDPLRGKRTDVGYLPVLVGLNLDSTSCLRVGHRGAKRAPQVETQIIIREAANQHQEDTLRTGEAAPTM